MSLSSPLLFGVSSVVLAVFVHCVGAHQDISLNNQFIENSNEHNAWPNWPWGDNKFKCPSSFGSFSDPEDCSYYYVCVANRGTRKQCKRLMQFDKNLRKCVSFIIAVCDDSGKKKTTTIAPRTKVTTPGGDDDKFTCPSMLGSFLHPTDCRKYYKCTFFISSLKTCPDSELFDGVKQECRPANTVHCGSRTKPTEATTIALTTIQPTTTTTEAPPTTTKELPVITTTEPPAITTTEPSVITTTEPPVPTTTEPPAITTTEPPTTLKPKVTAPDTDCDEDDLDCIIDDLGENPVWFVCDKDMGSYPHPTSKKLFIFCLNWKPTVKKCGQNLVFSEELMTCASP